jgi:hypothetical protein
MKQRSIAEYQTTTAARGLEVAYLLIRYVVAEGKRSAFEHSHASDGPWQTLLKQHAGHVHTDLLFSVEEKRTFLSLNFMKDQESCAGLLNRTNRALSKPDPVRANASR